MKPGQEYGWDQYAEMEAELTRLRAQMHDQAKMLGEGRVEIVRLRDLVALNGREVLRLRENYDAAVGEAEAQAHEVDRLRKDFSRVALDWSTAIKQRDTLLEALRKYLDWPSTQAMDDLLVVVAEIEGEKGG